MSRRRTIHVPDKLAGPDAGSHGGCPFAPVGSEPVVRADPPRRARVRIEVDQRTLSADITPVLFAKHCVGLVTRSQVAM